jgi:hypothetical protein
VEWAAFALRLKLLSFLGHVIARVSSILKLIIAIVYIYYELQDQLEIQVNAFFSLLYTRISIPHCRLILTPLYIFAPLRRYLQGI